ncbi:MAG: gamma-glutamyl-gamma-aminobutyrate hydrolase family protein [Gammaproteobacteria bacterium]
MLKRSKYITHKPGQKSILYFYPSAKRLKQDESIRKTQSQAGSASIAIPYRDDGRGKGAFFDHLAIQKTINTRTVISSYEGANISHLEEYARAVTFHLPYKAPNKIIPEECSSKEFDGLLFIPGTTRENKKKQPNEFLMRNAHEDILLKQALLRGQPILAVCGGAWKLWKHMGGDLKTVSGHCSASMPRIKETSGKVGNNRQIHRIQFTSSAFIIKAAMMAADDFKPSVNSVHWLSVDETKPAQNMEVCAVAINDPEMVSKHRNGESMEPENGSAEEFEAKFGSPILGIQWHPEAYTHNTPSEYESESHRGVIRYMQQAGSAYATKRKMLLEYGRLNFAERIPKKEGNSLLKNSKFLIFSEDNTSYTHMSEAKRSLKFKGQYNYDKVQAKKIEKRKLESLSSTIPDKNVNLKFRKPLLL